MSEYQEFTGKTVEEALRAARDAFEVGGLDDLDFEILTPGSRGVLGMGAEPARILAAPRSALGGAAPRREAAAATPLPTPPPRPREEGRFGDRDRDRGGRFGDRDRGGRFGDRDRDRGDRDRGGRFGERDRGAPGRDRFGDRDRGSRDRAPVGDDGRPADGATEQAPAADHAPAAEAPREREQRPRPDRGRDDRGRDDRVRRDRPQQSQEEISALIGQEVGRRAALSIEREEIQAAEASPEALEAARDILQQLLGHMGYRATVSIQSGETSKLDVTGDDAEKEALGALIGRKGERLSALQHLVNLMLSRKMGAWTRVLVDVEDYRGRRERQLREIAMRAAERVLESGKMLQLEPMPALERRWIHLALRDHAEVMTQSIGDEPQRRVVILRRPA
jgi:spoIIIJ-associated protein